MKNQTNLIKRIRNIIVGNTLPANEDLWLDTSEGEKKVVLKYKGNPIVGGGSNSGYSSTKQTVTLFNNTVETQESGGIYACDIENIDFDLVAGETYTVVFDGTSYDIKAITSPGNVSDVLLGEIVGGEFSFETYPFIILYCVEEGEKFMEFATNIEGSHTVEIKHEEETVTTSPEFKSAVDSVTGYSIEEGYETLYENTIEYSSGTYYYADSNFFKLVVGDSYKVTLNGTVYDCVCFDDGHSHITIGADWNSGATGYDWSIYPFVISYEEGYPCYGKFQNSGTYDIKIEHLTTFTKTTPVFESIIQGIACGVVYYENLTDDEWDILRSANPGITFNDAKKVTTANADTNRVVVWDERYEGNGSITNLYVAEVLYMGNKPYFIRLQDVYNSTTIELQIPFNHYVNSISTEGLSDDYFYYFEIPEPGAG